VSRRGILGRGIVQSDINLSGYSQMEARGSTETSINFHHTTWPLISTLTLLGEYGELLIIPADGRWDLTRRLKG
jgi:hypothetical protein